MKNILITKIRKSLLGLILLSFLTQGCSNNDTNPTQPQPLKDPRTYTWIADTLSFFGSAQVLMNSIWGSSPKDVYAVGHNDQSLGVMWHFDGNNWTDVKLNSSFQGGNIFGTISLSSIYGLSSNDIYAVGEHISNSNTHTSRIIHYNGTTWTEVNLQSVGSLLNTVYGTNSNNVWVGGENALYHYDGVKWTRDSVLVSVPSDSYFQFTSISSYNSKIYALGLTNDNKANFTHYFFKESNSNVSIIDSFVRANGVKFGTNLWKSSNGTLYSAGLVDFYKYNGVSWINLFKVSNIRNINGTDDNNIFVVGDFGLVYHFNGTDWQNIAPKLSKDTRTLYTGVWTDGTEAFIIEQPQTGFPAKTVIWHGK